MLIPKESERMRKERIAGTGNGATLRTKVVQDRKKYSRKEKHCKKSIAEAMDFFIASLFEPMEKSWRKDSFVESQA